MIKAFIYWFKGLFTCRVYIACRMTHRNRREMIQRAKYVSAIFKKAGVEAISPVLRERVPARPGKLKNPSKIRLFKKWTDDKDILCWEAHGMAWDEAQDKSTGAEREHGINRYLWWKPTVIILPEPHGITVAVFEDDLISGDVEAVAHYFSEHHGNLYKRWKWRLMLLNRCLVKFVVGQIWQWVH
jgi:hypothetical protein